MTDNTLLTCSKCKTKFASRSMLLPQLASLVLAVDRDVIDAPVAGIINVHKPTCPIISCRGELIADAG